MRLVDADAYADELKRREKLCFYQIDNADVNATVSEIEYWSGVIGTFNEAMCVLADAPTVGGWISVKDKPPEKSGWYQVSLVNTRTGHRWEVPVPADYSHGEWNYAYLGGDDATWTLTNTVTHWMPLPKPPEVNEND